MISFSQGVIHLTSNCTFRCLGCALGQQDFQPEPEIRFRFIPTKKVMHLVGGEALCAESLVKVLAHYKRRGTRCVIWTHGQFDITQWAPILEFNPTVALYLPSPDEASFNTISGVSGWEIFHERATYLAAKDIELVLNFPVREGQLEFIPDAQELATHYLAKLVMHYHPGDFDRNSVAYIRRYLNFAGVFVLSSPPPPPSFCPAFPYGGLLNPWQIAQNLWWDYLGSKGKLWQFGG